MLFRQIRLELLQSASNDSVAVNIFSLKRQNGQSVFTNGFPVCSTLNPSFPPENAFDDNPDTFWATENLTETPFIGYYFDEPVDIQISELPLYLTVYNPNNENRPLSFQLKLFPLNRTEGLINYGIEDNQTELVCFKNLPFQQGDFRVRQLSVRQFPILTPKEKRTRIKELKTSAISGNVINLERALIIYLGNIDKANNCLSILESSADIYSDLTNAGFSKTQSTVIAAICRLIDY